jgi:2-succinyl-6-hydroxy-2,4-cyclohexadiene-1-carboxylate synthase
MKKRVALHSFLGSSDDWCHLTGDILSPVIFDPELGLKGWAKRFNQTRQSSGTLIGYSMGGRLALHVLIDNPNLWERAVIISTHPGLKDEQEKEERLRSDREWAGRFETEPWDALMKAWNSQPVFLGSKQPLREEKDYDRKRLAGMLRSFSLGLQDDFREEIARLPMPILWVVGERDLKFRMLASELKFQNPLSRVMVAVGAGHRVI